MLDWREKQGKSKVEFRLKSNAKWLGIVLSATLLLQAPLASAEAASNQQVTISSAAANQAQGPAIKLISEEPITAGAQLRKYIFSTTRQNAPATTNVNMIVVDLQHPYVELDVMSGVNGDILKRQTVRNMAKETGAVAGVNADFFNMQVRDTPPLGPVISEGHWLTTPVFSQGWYTFGVSKDRKAVIDYYEFKGAVTAPNGASYPLAGMNRHAQWKDGQHSHVDQIFMYTSDWQLADRGGDSHYTPSEIYVEDGRIVDMSIHQTLPFTNVPENGLILRTNRQATEFFQQNFQIGDPIQIEYDMKPLDSNNAVWGKDLSMLIGGHTLLVKDGQPSTYTLDVSKLSGSTARTGVGISQDGRYVYLFTADNSGASKGMTLKEMQDFMISVGVWKGMNLDGGGSTQLVSRPLGEHDAVLVNQTQESSARSVANGIGIYTTAPQGELLDFTVQGPRTLLLHERGGYSLKAYDTYYNPLKVSDETPVQWSVDPAFGRMDGNMFIPSKVGETTITAVSGTARSEFVVSIAGREQIQSLSIDAANLVLTEGGTYRLPVIAILKNGQKKELASESIKWEFIGFKGSMDGQMLTVESIEDDAAVRLIASYDGFSTILSASTGADVLWADFDTISHPVEFKGYPNEVKGWAQMLNGFPELAEDDHILHIMYDFLEVPEGKSAAAYASFNQDLGIDVPGEPTQMSMQLLGDNSKNWVRAELLDSQGNVKVVDISRDVNWYGFKEIHVDLARHQLSYPIKLKRIYVVSPEEGQAEREKGGAIGVNDIVFHYRSQAKQAEKIHVELTIDQPLLKAGDRTLQLEQAPIITNRTTLIPVHFIEDVLGGEARWHGEERKVTLLKDDHLVELWIDEQELIVDGKRVTSPVAPIIMNRRTMVPLRVISEAFGWDVTWVGETRSVVLQ